MAAGWIFGILIGLMVGVILTSIVYFGRVSFGTLRIDRQNPEKDIYRFDIDGDIVNLPKKKRIVMKIDPNADLSQD